MEINEKTISTKEELINVIIEGVNPLKYIKNERDIDFVCNALTIKGNDEYPFFEESAENLLRAILYYLVYTENEEKTLERCKEITKMGLNEEDGRDKLRSLLEKEERAKSLYMSIEIAPDKTYKAIFEKLNERLSNT